MRHRRSGRKLNRTSAHRKAAFQNLAAALIRHERIQTTLPKAKELRPIVERLVTLGKQNTLHARRIAMARLPRDADIAKLFGPLSERFASRPGGYTRIVRSGYRYGDAAAMAYIEFVDKASAERPRASVEPRSVTEVPRTEPAPADEPADKRPWWRRLGFGDRND